MDQKEPKKAEMGTWRKRLNLAGILAVDAGVFAAAQSLGVDDYLAKLPNLYETAGWAGLGMLLAGFTDVARKDLRFEKSEGKEKGLLQRVKEEWRNVSIIHGIGTLALLGVGHYHLHHISSAIETVVQNPQWSDDLGRVAIGVGLYAANRYILPIIAKVTSKIGDWTPRALVMGTQLAALAAPLVAAHEYGLLKQMTDKEVVERARHKKRTIIDDLRLPEEYTPEMREMAIRDAGSEFKIEPALIKAVIKQESSGNPKAKSYSGCRGLMQICRWGSYRNVLERHGLERRSSPYEEKANILVGTHILREKMNSMRKVGFASKDDRLQAAIASYNIGQKVIRKAAKIAGREKGRAPTWKETLEALTPELLEENGYTDEKGWHNNEKCNYSRPCKIRGLRHYVSRIYHTYRKNRRIEQQSAIQVARAE